MKGVEVFDFTLKHLPLEFEKILKFSCLKKEQLSRLYFHQANSFLLSYLEEKLDVKGKLLNNMKNFGNTSSNSIPLLISDTKDKDYENVMFMGFGVGFSVATCILEFLDCSCSLIYKD